MYDLRNLREMLCKELDEIADNAKCLRAIWTRSRS